MADDPGDESLAGFELDTAAGEPQSRVGDATLDAIIKVDEPGYVPPAADRRATISDTLFTANVQRAQLGELERDPRVVSIELSERLGRID